MFHRSNYQEEAALLAESEKKEDMPVLSEKLLKKLKMYAQGDGIDEADAQVRELLEVGAPGHGPA